MSGIQQGAKGSMKSVMRKKKKTQNTGQRETLEFIFMQATAMG